MATDDIFDSAVRSAGDMAAIFEYDGDTGYFYLYETRQPQGHRIVAAIQVLVGEPDFDGKDISVRWDTSETKVGLFIRRQLWAAFDGQTQEGYGGDYRQNTQPRIPVEIIDAFQPR
jgi:hypothetical protein